MIRSRTPRSRRHRHDLGQRQPALGRRASLLGARRRRNKKQRGGRLGCLIAGVVGAIVSVFASATGLRYAWIVGTALLLAAGWRLIAQLLGERGQGPSAPRLQPALGALDQELRTSPDGDQTPEAQGASGTAARSPRLLLRSRRGLRSRPHGGSVARQQLPLREQLRRPLDRRLSWTRCSSRSERC